MVRLNRSFYWVLVLILANRVGALEAHADGSAGKAFKEGKRLFAERKYISAIAAFHRAYELKPHFMVQCSIARCYENLNNMVKATEHYKRCLEEGAKEKKKIAKRIRVSLEKTESQITWVTIESPGKGGTIYLDGTSLGAVPKRVGTNPGKHVVEVRRPGARPAQETFSTLGGEEKTFSLAPIDLPTKRPEKKVLPSKTEKRRNVITVRRPPPRRGLSQVWFWTAGGATVALGAATIILGVMTVQARSDYEAAPTEAGYDTFVQRRLITNLLLGGTALAAAGSTLLFFYTDFGGKEAPSSVNRARVVIGLQGVF